MMFNITPFLVMFLLLLIIILYQGSKISKLTKKYDTFMEGSDGKSLEEKLLTNAKELQTIRLKQEQQDFDILDISDRVDGAFSKMGVVKYDAFTGLGGKLSFAITVLNEKKDGYIINCMQSDHGSYVYAKEITHGKSNIDLSPEEEESLNKAL